ncbi:Phosphoserine aminotransferase, chloroplast precursor (PSAT) (fragment) [Xenorhabdus nematophila ATCC 19061]|uniref:Phosphoserine aminotransferase, chloroplast (PSAT) n=1 Tax=Xenorhabdus nematophila (strain ATCC 19061 / DSM 3370 / CCUG 14189 / LMG 1036 / NCIMB 9965 / AN6) TaxID=406817 RepID=D3VE09_XENNA
MGVIENIKELKDKENASLPSFISNVNGFYGCPISRSVPS